MLSVGSLFTGIGGIDLGLERAGMRVVWQAESDDYCYAVLRKHWPDVPNYGDVRNIPGVRMVCPDLICGGFPCQPFSHAGKRQGTDDERWLWPEFARIVGLLEPRYVVVENVPGLLAGHGGMGNVLGDLAALGYDAEWDCIPASAVGAPHRRDRVWIVGYPHGEGESVVPVDAEASGLSCLVADTERSGLEGRGRRALRERAATGGGQRELQDSDERTVQPRRIWGRAPQADSSGWWAAEPDVGRVAHGVPNRLDRLAALGNAVVPQVAEHIGRLIIEAENELRGVAV